MHLLVFQLMGSAPQFPHGIIDNIVEIGKVHFLVFLPNLEKKKTTLIPLTLVSRTSISRHLSSRANATAARILPFGGGGNSHQNKLSPHRQWLHRQNSLFFWDGGMTSQTKSHHSQLFGNQQRHDFCFAAGRALRGTSARGQLSGRVPRALHEEGRFPAGAVRLHSSGRHQYFSRHTQGNGGTSNCLWISVTTSCRFVQTFPSRNFRWIRVPLSYLCSAFSQDHCKQNCEVPISFCIAITCARLDFSTASHQKARLWSCTKTRGTVCSSTLHNLIGQAESTPVQPLEVSGFSK